MELQCSSELHRNRNLTSVFVKFWNQEMDHIATESDRWWNYELVHNTSENVRLWNHDMSQVTSEDIRL